MNYIVRIEPSRDLLAVLTTLGIEWDLSISSNGDGGWALVKLDDELDSRLLEVWDRLTELRWRYIEQCQRGNAIQLILPLGGDGDE